MTDMDFIAMRLQEGRTPTTTSGRPHRQFLRLPAWLHLPR